MKPKHYEAVLLRLEPDLLKRIDASAKKRAKEYNLPNFWSRTNELRLLLALGLQSPRRPVLTPLGKLHVPAKEKKA